MERSDEYGSTGNVNRSWHISSNVARSARYVSTVQFEARSHRGHDIAGSFMVEDIHTDPYGYVTTTSGTGTAREASISVIFNTVRCTYSASFSLESDVLHTDDEGNHDGNLLVASVRLPGQPAEQSAMGGNLQLPTTVSATTPHFVFGGDSASGVVAKNPGTADFSWSMIPGTAP